MRVNNEKMRRLINYVNRARLKNHDFSLIASNCNGAIILHDLGLQFRSPFVNLWMKPDEYIAYLKDMDFFNQCNLNFTSEEGIHYPIGELGGLKIYFQHYASEKDAMTKWKERLSRLNKDNLFIILTERDGCTYENLCEFDNLPYKNKIVFTHRPYDNIKSAVYVRGFESQGECGILSGFRGKYFGKRYYDDFDYVKWFNGK